MLTKIIALLLGFELACFATASKDTLFLLEPGVRVGPITQSSSVEDIKKSFPSFSVIKAKCRPDEGLLSRKTCHLVKEGNKEVLRVDDYTHGSRVVEILDSRFQSKEGLALGNSLGELLLANCVPFEFYPPNAPGAVGGLVTDWGASGSMCKAVWAEVQPTKNIDDYEKTISSLLASGVPKDQVYSRWPELRRFELKLAKLTIELDSSLKSECTTRPQCIRDLEQ